MTLVFQCDTTHPSMPKAWKDLGWAVRHHKSLGVVQVSFVDGEMYINNQKVLEYLSDKQDVRIGGYIGHDLYEELSDKLVLPDPVLDLLVRLRYKPHVRRFLSKYKDQKTFFWGTIYVSPEGELFVRCLDGVDLTTFNPHCRRLDFGWRYDDGALILEGGI